MAPAVSVVIPTYQRRELVKRAVASVLAQTYADFELVVVDDGSTDGTEAALRGVDGRIRYHRRPHRGVAAARNAGIRLARAPIVAFLDSDDRWLPEHLAVVTEVLERRADAVLVTTSPRFFVAGREPVGNARLVDALPLTLFECFGGYASCVGVRRDALVACGGFDERLAVMEDCDLWLRLSELGPFAVLQRRTFIHQATRDSLVKRGVKSGAYLRDEELVALSALAIAGRSRRPDRDALVRRAQGRAAFATALRAIVERDDAAAAQALESACLLLPDLREAQDFVSRRIVKLAPSPEERLRIVSAAARLWPDRRADTAIYLRYRAAGLALRRDPRLALALLAGTPLSPMPSFIVRNRSRWARLTRRRLQRVRYGGRESPELTVGG